MSQDFERRREKREKRESALRRTHAQHDFDSRCCRSAFLLVEATKKRGGTIEEEEE